MKKKTNKKEKTNTKPEPEKVRVNVPEKELVIVIDSCGGEAFLSASDYMHGLLKEDYNIALMTTSLSMSSKQYAKSYDFYWACCDTVDVESFADLENSIFTDDREKTWATHLNNKFAGLCQEKIQKVVINFEELIAHIGVPVKVVLPLGLKNADSYLTRVACQTVAIARKIPIVYYAEFPHKNSDAAQRKIAELIEQKDVKHYSVDVCDKEFKLGIVRSIFPHLLKKIWMCELPYSEENYFEAASGAIPFESPDTLEIRDGREHVCEY